ncbi:MAG: hypothetical protein IPG23_19150 [Burkholderiales bacterium]|nr:hypothetical protein [Burkholderiales bacterium]MBP8018621.1 hypothetical protein [Hylemonella sp.]
MNKINSTLTALAIALLAVAPLSLQAQSTPAEPGDGLRIATGKKGKGYSKLFADLRAVCGSQVAITEVETEGGLQNLTTLAANQADLGFVQLDTLQDMKGSDDNIGNLLALMPLNANLLHIVARSEAFSYQGPKRTWPLPSETITVSIDKFSDLKNLPVAVVGSARALGRVLDRRFVMNMRFVDVDTDEQALAKLKSGEVAGMLSTSGWPSGPIQKLKRDSNAKLLPFDLAVQPPYQLVKKNYENLDTFNHGFLAAPNLLVTRPFSNTGANGKAAATLQSCIQKNVRALQEGKFEPAWAEVKNTSETYGWPKFLAAGRR